MVAKCVVDVAESTNRWQRLNMGYVFTINIVTKDVLSTTICWTCQLSAFGIIVNLYQLLPNL